MKLTEEHRMYLREKDINELISWLGYIREDYVAGKADPYHVQTVCRMVNLLYGRKALPNKINRKNRKHMRTFKRGWQ